MDSVMSNVIASVRVGWVRSWQSSTDWNWSVTRVSWYQRGFMDLCCLINFVGDKKNCAVEKSYSIPEGKSHYEAAPARRDHSTLITVVIHVGSRYEWPVLSLLQTV